MLRHFWARHLEQFAWRFEGPGPWGATCFQTKIEIGIWDLNPMLMCDTA